MNVNRMCSRVFYTACTALLAGAMASAQSPQSNPGSPSSQSPSTSPSSPGMGTSATPGMTTDPGNGMMDKAFVKKAMQGGMAEVDLGKLAAEKGSSEDVKQFGQQMVDDHSKLNEQMKPVAAQLGVSAPKEPSKKDQELKTKLQALSGQQFDEAYIKAMLKDHKKDHDEFSNEAQNAQDPNVKQVAQQGDQLIQQHLQHIEQIAQAHNIPASGKSKGGA